MSDEIKQHINEAVGTAIKVHVNGKIDRLREDMEKANKEQNEKIDELMAVFKDTTTFFRVLVKIVQSIIPLGAAFGVLYSVGKWIKGQ